MAGDGQAPAFCTIIAKNYLAHARVLANSLRQHHPNIPTYVLVIDDLEGYFDPNGEPFDTTRITDLNLPGAREFCFRYDVMELCTAVKPPLLRLLLERGHSQVVYLDPDIYVYRPLTELLTLLSTSDMLLTPHLLHPIGDDKRPGERDILMSGTYNLGFLAIAQSEQIDPFLAWWSERCERQCVRDPTHGLFVDQRWMDLAPGFLERVRVLRHPGYNVAYWNLPERQLDGPADAPHVNAEPVYFYHYSGFDPARPDVLSRYEDRYVNIAGEPLRTMAQEYSDALLRAGHLECRQWPYSYGTFRNGQPVTRELRELFREHRPGRFPDPFDTDTPDSFLSWALAPGSAPAPGKSRRRFLKRRSPTDSANVTQLAPLAARILQKRPDLQKAFLDSPSSVRLRDYLTWLAGDGVLQHQLHPSWCDAWLGKDSNPQGVVKRAIALYEADPKLQRRFPMAFVQQHDAPAFLGWLESHGMDRGFSASDLARLKEVAAGRPFERIRDIYQSRSDLQRIYPNVLQGPRNPDFLDWLRHHGRGEYHLSEDHILWFEKEIDQHVCLFVEALYRSRPDWQREHPLGLSPFGRKRFLDWLKGGAGRSLGIDVRALSDLCTTGRTAPLQDLQRYYDSDAPLRSRFPGAFRDPDATQRFLQWLRENVAPELDLKPEWLQGLESQLRACLQGATVVGYLQTESGKGEETRATVRALTAVNYPVTTVNFTEAPQRQLDVTVTRRDAGYALPFSILHLNADEVLQRGHLIEPWRHGSYVIGYWAWELAEFPEHWREAFTLLQEIWAPSRHAAASIARASPIPVQPMPLCLPDLHPSALGRAAFGLPEDRFLFLFMYDVLSETERKNPLGLIEAFRRAFRSDDRVHLALKVSNGNLRRADIARVMGAAKGLPITVIDQYFLRADVLALLAACDAYVSLHRAEGFGLTLAEAMALGRPVIATYYSGNVDFMTPWNSFPAPFRLVEITQDWGPYRRGCHWADPDLDVAADLMRRIYTNPESARDVAERGRAEIKEMLSPGACGRRIVARLSAIQTTASSDRRSEFSHRSPDEKSGR